MVEFVRVTAKTPHGECWEYAFMGDLDTESDQIRLAQFMLDCCDDCADRFGCPDEWDAIEWRDKTMAMWEAIESQRMEFGPPVEYNPYRNVWGGAR